jgi:hypothetical protein
MKYKFTLLFVVLFFGAVQAQINLVPNPSFEDTVYCPTGLKQLDACVNWLNFGGSPDYFNACTPFGLPNSVFGFQKAHTGNAYAGVAFYSRPSGPSGPNYRENIAIELTSNLVIGIKYFVSFFVVNAAVNNGSIACNKQGVNFYTLPFNSNYPPPLLNVATLFNDSILTDTLNWTKISGSFIADSSYQYLSISNFFDDNNTDTLITSPFSIPYHAYYYIDDVCVSTDSLYNETWTGIIHQKKDELIINIYPNPSKGFLMVESPILIDNYSIYNIQGQLMNKVKVNTASSFEINLSNNLNGMYFLQIQTAKGISNYKIILTQQ